jgi:uncharacterized protein YheU (UPF0270 family)
MRIPWNRLSSNALTGLIEEYVTREGTEYGRTEFSLARKVAQVRQQLETGEAYIFFDPDAQTCNILLANAALDEDSQG